jgi:hypothetical protein
MEKKEKQKTLDYQRGTASWEDLADEEIWGNVVYIGFDNNRQMKALFETDMNTDRIIMKNSRHRYPYEPQ